MIFAASHQPWGDAMPDGIPIIGSLFPKAPSAPPPPPILPAPTPPPSAGAAASDPAANAARVQALAAASRAKGRRDTIVNPGGGAGVTGDAPARRAALYATPKATPGS